MQNNSKIPEIKKNLPLGSKILLVERTGLTKQTIDNILNGKTGRMKNVISVIVESEKIISEYKKITEKVIDTTV